MAFQFSVDLRNAALDQMETQAGASCILRLRTGSVPANCAAADSGSVVAEMNLPADWMAAASNGSKSKLGTWEDPAANLAAQIGHFRIYDSGGTNCKIQGTVSLTSGGGDMELDDDEPNVGQTITITSFTLNAGGA